MVNNQQPATIQPPLTPAPKNNLYTLLLIIPILLISIFVFLPFLQSLYMSFKHYNIMSGLLGSPFVGLRNYVQNAHDSFYPALLRNSFRLVWLPTLVATTVGVLAILIAPALKTGMPRGIFFLVFTVLAAIPESAWVFFFSTEARVKTTLPLYFAIGIRTASIAALLCGAVACLTRKPRHEKQGFLPYSGLILFLFGQICSTLSPSFTGINQTSPLNYESTLTFDSNIYKTGLFQLNYSQASALWVTKVLFQLAAAIVFAILLLWIFARKTPIPPLRLEKDKKGSNSLSLIVAILGLAVLIIGFASKLLREKDVLLFSGAFASLLGVVGTGIVIALLVTPLALASSQQRIPVIAILCLILSGFSGNFVSEFLLFRQIHVLAVPIFTSFSFILIGYVCYLAYLGGKKSIPYLLPLVGVIMATAASSSVYPSIFFRNATQYTLPMIIQQQHQTTLGFAHFLLFALCVSLAIISSSLAFRKEAATDPLAESLDQSTMY